MSVKVMGWVFEHSRSTLGDRLVLLAIADSANHDGEDAWPSVDEIARKAHVHRATVFRAIENLVALGELNVFHKGGPAGKNRYQVVVANCDGGKLRPSHPVAEKSQDATYAPLYLNRPDPSFSETAFKNALDAARDLSQIVPTATLRRGEPIR